MLTEAIYIGRVSPTSVIHSDGPVSNTRAIPEDILIKVKELAMSTSRPISTYGKAPDKALAEESTSDS
jgi:hypothetical protein